MDIGQIGHDAGACYNYLKKHGKGTKSQLQKGLKLSESRVAMALGWLAREGKLANSNERMDNFYRTKINYISLKPE